MSKSIPVVAARDAKNHRVASTPTSSTSSSRVMNSPARFDMETRTIRRPPTSITWSPSPSAGVHGRTKRTHE